MKIPEVFLVEVEHSAGSLARVLEVAGEAGLLVESSEIVRKNQCKTIWELTVEVDEEADQRICTRIDALPAAKILGRSDRVWSP